MKKKSDEIEKLSADSTELSAGLLSRLLNSSRREYEPQADSLYRQYRDMYSEGAKKAAENAYGLAASNSGGWGSSYALSAARGAYSDYMKGLDSKAAELQESAEKRAESERESLIDAYRLAGDYEDRLLKRASEKESSAYRAAKDAGDYSRLQALGIDVSQLKNEDLYDIAKIYAQYGDYSLLSGLGVDTSAKRSEQALENEILRQRLKNYYR